MSSKDYTVKSECPICKSFLPGSDDAGLIFDCLVGQVKEIEAGANYEPNCNECGDECSLAEAKKIIRAGKPEIVPADDEDFNY